MSMNRRSFLKAAGAAAAAGAGLSLPSFLGATEGWGPIPNGAWPHDARKILQIILPGGCSIWENFWVENIDDEYFAGYADQVSGLSWSCTGSPNPADQLLGFDNDQGGHEIYWGPATKPLWSSHILDHTRMITQALAHPTPPHEVGMPLMVGGHKVGDVKLASVAAAVEHRYQSIEARDTPYSCVIAPQSTGLLRSLFMNSGMHPFWAKPLLLKLGSGGSTLKQQLERAGVTTSSDLLFNLYRSQYRDLLRFQGQGNPVGSAGFDAYDHAAYLLGKAGSLDDILSDELLEVENGTPCAADPPNALMPNTTKAGLELAAHLLSLPHAEGGMRYVAMIDGGLREAPGGAGMPYDTHGPNADDPNLEWNSSVAVTSANLWNVLYHLSQIIQSPGLGLLGGGPSTPKIDLGDVTVVISSEFTRTAAPKANLGRDHWAGGFVSVVISDLVSRGISGALDNHSADAGYTYGPQDICALQMLLAGVWPFETENFDPDALSDAVRDGEEDEDVVVEKIEQKFLA
jgi:hypothetical protein